MTGRHAKPRLETTPVMIVKGEAGMFYTAWGWTRVFDGREFGRIVSTCPSRDDPDPQTIDRCILNAARTIDKYLEGPTRRAHAGLSAP